MTFDEWWEDFVAEHDEWKYADSAALRRAAFQAGAASRDAEVVSLTNQDDLSALRAHDAALTAKHIEICKKLAAENEGLAGEVWCERCADAIEKGGV